MLARSKWRLCFPQIRRLFGSSDSDFGGKNSNNAVSSAAICGLLAAYYGFIASEEERKNIFNDWIRQKFSLFAAAKTRKNRNQAVKNATAVVAAAASEALSNVTPPPMSMREKRFLEFASVEYQGQAFMTPSDFLDAVVEESPSDERIERRLLTEADAERMLRTRGPPTKGYFRVLGDNGLISYTEYLFLLCILTKPHASFRVAFNMLDADGNQYIDKKEFVVMERIFASTKFSKRLLQGQQFEKSLNNNLSPLSGTATSSEEAMSPGLHEHPHISLVEKNRLSEQSMKCDTTLLRRFFGRNARHVLTYEEFYKFMEDLQTEILEIEFNEFAHGQNTIKETEFARLLLRYAFAHRDAYLAYMKRIHETIQDTVGVTFEQYKQFCLFLTNLDDFAMAVKLYTYRDHPVTQGEFARAAKVSTGLALDPHILNTVFQIFDINEDGRLSYGEFLSIMRDRLHRGAKKIGHRNEWQLFKRCVREEMKRY